MLFYPWSADSCRVPLTPVNMSRTDRSPEPRFEWLREELRDRERLMSHDYPSFEHLLGALQSSGHSHCTRVWTKNTVAYRCRTCQIHDWRSAAAFAFLFLHITSPHPQPCCLLALWMWFLDASFDSAGLFMIAKVMSMSKMNLRRIVLETRVP